MKKLYCNRLTLPGKWKERDGGPKKAGAEEEGVWYGVYFVQVG